MEGPSLNFLLKDHFYISLNSLFELVVEQLVGRVRVEVHYGDRGSVVQEAGHHRAADAAGAARHDGDLQIHAKVFS